MEVTSTGFLVILIVSFLGFLMIDTGPSGRARAKFEELAGRIPDPNDVNDGAVLATLPVVALLFVIAAYILFN